MRRSFLVASAAAIVLAAREGGAEPSQGHLFRLGLSPWSIGTYDVPNSDGHYSQKGVSALEARLGYGYRVTRNLEIGALASGASVQEGKLAIVRLAAVLRGVVPLGGGWEVGGQLRGGVQESHLFAWNYFGPVVAFGFDAEVEISDLLGLVMGLDASIGGGSPSGVPADQRGDYFRDASLLTVAIMPYIGPSLRF
jgi:hypothetical protein